MKQRIYTEISRVGKALASPKRLELIELLAQRPQTVEDLSRSTGMSQASTSQHLGVLKTARVVESTKRGLYVTYRLAGDDVLRLYVALRELATNRVAEVQRITSELQGTDVPMIAVEADELSRRVNQGEVVLIDVRPRGEFDAGHLPGAISLPLPELEARLAELPSDRPVIAYCRGPYCVYASDAARLLRARGFDAMRTDQDPVAWRAAGLAVETTSELGR